MVRVYQINQRKKNFFDTFSVNTWLIGLNVFFFIVFLAIASRFGWDYIALMPANILGGKYFVDLFYKYVYAWRGISFIY